MRGRRSHRVRPALYSNHRGRCELALALFRSIKPSLTLIRLSFRSVSVHSRRRLVRQPGDTSRPGTRSRDHAQDGGKEPVQPDQQQAVRIGSRNRLGSLRIRIELMTEHLKLKMQIRIAEFNYSKKSRRCIDSAAPLIPGRLTSTWYSVAS